MGSALRTFVTTVKGVQVIAVASDLAEAVQVLLELQPHLLLMDADLAEDDLEGCLGSLLQVSPDLYLIVLVNDQRQRTISLANGASHALLKGRLNEELRRAIASEASS